jgi:hypothetical protein
MERFLVDVYLRETPTETEVQGALDFVNYQIMRIGVPTKREAFSILFESASEQLAPRLDRMAWSVETSREPVFFTSDRPVVKWRHPKRRSIGTGVGIENADEIRFPLSPKHLLVLRPSYPDRARYCIEPERARKVNRHLAAGCYKAVISRSDDPTIDNLALEPASPVMRFNSGPLYRRDENGELVDTGQEILHTYEPDVNDT